MVLIDPLITLLSAMSMTVALMGVAMCLMQRQDAAMFRVLAGFFLSIALTEFGEALAPSLAHEPTRIVLNAIWIVGASSVTPLLWLYIWMLTEPRQTWPKRVWLHGITPAIAVLICCLVFTLPYADQRILLGDADGEISIRAFIVGAAYESYAMLLVTVQWLVYLVMCARRLVKYRVRLKNVFASTEGKELRWVTAVIGVCGGYWLLGSVMLVLDLSGAVNDAPEVPEYALNLCVGAIIAIWGLRQRKVLQPRLSTAEPQAHAKYTKSALTSEMAARIAKKLHRAMAEDDLHLDPNLSLWSLSKHVGVSDNYVSQVLNEEIGQNFFDFVNGYRVTEAKKRLLSSDETILNIAFDIGFNSRSSFYAAFKKRTGQTPTAFRAGAVRPG